MVSFSKVKSCKAFKSSGLVGSYCFIVLYCLKGLRYSLGFNVL